jgi:ADP-heptose:LPS heptosyltransferase
MQRILVIRNDKLGDFMLAWPAFSLLKQQYPQASVTALVPGYTRPIAELCPWIDELIIDDRHDSTLADAVHLSRLIKAGHFDASISLFSEMRTALALWLARIPARIGPATKLAQVFLNRRLRQKRSQSRKPEYEYNADLVRYFIVQAGDKPGDMQAPPFLQFDAGEVADIRRAYMLEHHIDADRQLVFIHAGSGGSAINLSLQQFAELIERIDNAGRFHFVLSAGPGELDRANALSQLLPQASHSVYHSTLGLVNFARFIAACDLFISGSTGPLHIAGALNVPTAAFYPARQSATSLRWQTLNQEDRRIAFSPEKFSGDNDMQTIDIESCAQGIVELLGR